MALKSRGQDSAKLYEHASNSSLRGLELVVPPGAPSPNGYQDVVAQQKPLPRDPTSRRASVYTTDSEDMADLQDEEVEFNLFQTPATAPRAYSVQLSPMTMMDNHTEFPFPKPALAPGKGVGGSQPETLIEERRLSRWERQPGDPATYFAEQYRSGLAVPSVSSNELQDHDPREIVDRYLRLSMPPTPMTLQQPPQRSIPWKETRGSPITSTAPPPPNVRNATSPLSLRQQHLANDIATYLPNGKAGKASVLEPRPPEPSHAPGDENDQSVIEDLFKPSFNPDRDYRRWEIEHSLIPSPLAPRKSAVPVPLPPPQPSTSEPAYTGRKIPFSATSRASSTSAGQSAETRSRSSIVASIKASITPEQRSDYQVMQYVSQKYPSMPQPQPNMARKFSTFATSQRNSINSTLADMYDTLGRLSVLPRGIRPELKPSGMARDPARKSKDLRSPAIPLTPYQRNGPAGWEKSEPTSPTSTNGTKDLFNVGKTFAWMKRWREERLEKSKERRREELRGQIRVLGAAAKKHGVDLI